MTQTIESAAIGTANLPAIDAQLRQVLSRFPELVLGLVFGSVAQGRQRPDSDLDIAVHNYEAINWYIVHNIVKNRLADFTAFARVVSLKLNPGR